MRGMRLADGVSRAMPDPIAPMPIRPLSALTALLHAYIALRLLPALAVLTPAWPLALLALMVSALTIPLPFLSRRIERNASMGEALKWIGLISMGWFSSMFVLTLVRDAGLLLTWLASALGGVQVQWNTLRPWSALAVLVIATATSAIGFLNARRTASVKRVEVPIRGLPQALEGFTIAQLSDIHVGPTIKSGYIQRIVEVVNRLGADTIAITGDLVDGSVPELREHIAPLAGLRARHGTFVVTGNHEYYAGAHAWIDELRRLGLKVLLNEHVVLQTRNVRGAQTDEELFESALVLAGVTDFTAGHFDAAHASDPHLALHDAPPLVHTRVLLAHQPRSAPLAAAAGYQLQLSGHTHGGQFFPWNLFVPMQQPFTAGLHRLHDMWVYVSRGTGYWGPPKRFGAPSEITLLTLVPAA
ncbi:MULTISPECIES: metallophosphoesterase [Variovorax]|uniref:metallophosphoesterase n=1 Tax=Variovorax TaxID=34072 RepID=UPI00086D8E0A|nr:MULTISPECIES: metallophosphoesterase [Variovorax]MBN8755248.1 metallophosphoesterase [Variovorax sp.]ODU15998.1 MAG: serine/threonine protein phosphatase [Variovorax sp. SCN 67-85]ODV21244.1 MAG: serine/threonine protein phosphatase [Variovorax sp. SCN 67-20]OJZ14196.1 MAG: serine/threonine protein phosphatase [Variovorax sp. 67-131]UKI08402.1 metallophosphoesterase [Variovorax paradoxus]